MIQQKQLHFQNRFCQPLSFILEKIPNLDDQWVPFLKNMMSNHPYLLSWWLFSKCESRFEKIGFKTSTPNIPRTSHWSFISEQGVTFQILSSIFTNISELTLHQCVIDAPDMVSFPSLNKLSLKYCVFHEKTRMICSALFQDVQIVQKLN